MATSGLLSRRTRLGLVVVCAVFSVVGVVRGASWMAIAALVAVMASQIVILLAGPD